MSSTQLIVPFAKLYPANIAAHVAFHELALEMKKNPSRYKHHSQFIHINPEPESVIPQHSSDSSTPEPARPRTPTPPQETWTGNYSLSWDVKPLTPKFGWIIGAGRWTKNQQDGEVDLLLTLSKSETKVTGRHARIGITDNGTTILVSANKRSSILLEDEEFSDAQRVIGRDGCRVHFGRLAYTFQWFVVDEDAEKYYREGLANFLRDYRACSPPPQALSAVPTDKSYTLLKWVVQGTVGRGTFGTVMVGRHRITADAVAIKQVLREARNLKDSHTEVRVARRLPKHPRIAELLDVVYERGEEWYSGPEPERVYLIWQPFAQGTFEVLLDPRISIEKRVVFFWQALHGLHILHEHGFMHRDIKLKNIGVVGIRRPRAVLLDFGQATFKSPVSPTPGGVGTKPYLAPEMEIDLYTNAVDIWALGVVGVQLFAMTDGKLPWHEIQRDRNRHSQLIQQLSSRETHLVDNLLAQMLKWDANARISATDALSHRCFATLDDAEKYPELNESNPRKRPLE